MWASRLECTATSGRRGRSVGFETAVRSDVMSFETDGSGGELLQRVEMCASGRASLMNVTLASVLAVC